MTDSPISEPTRVPQRNERWLTRDGSETVRVMASGIEGYVVARYKGAMPFLLHINDWHKKFKPPVNK